MRRGIVVVLVAACLCGLLLLSYGNALVLVGIGLACVIFAFLYTTLLSYCGFGDLLVLVFFGIVPVLGTYYVQTADVSREALLVAFVCGLLIDTLIIMTNYRDRETDRRSGKRTLIALWGEKFGRYFYLAMGLVSWALCAGFLAEGKVWAFVLPTLYVPLHVWTWHRMVQIGSGKALNAILGETSRNMLLFALLLSAGLLLN